MNTNYTSSKAAKTIARLLFCFVTLLLDPMVSHAQIDAHATSETKSLYCYLKSIKGTGLVAGQQFFTYSGQVFNDPHCTLDTSDCLASTGSHPGMLGVDYSKSQAILRPHMANTYNHGGIVTMHWTMNNLVTGGSANDTTAAVYAIIPGGYRNAYYKKLLDTLGTFCKSLKGSDSNLIPVIFRPFHECTGNEDWWGASHCTNTQYIALYQFTVSYLRDTLGVHNLLYAFAPARPADQLPEQYSYRYPGDNYIDIIGFDRYNKDNQNYSSLLVQDCDTVVKFAERRNKVAAITESGVKDGAQNTSIHSWFTTQFLNPIMDDTVARKVAYWLTWSNSSPTTYWVPVASQPTYHSFDSLYNNAYILSLNKLPSTIYNSSTCGTGLVAPDEVPAPANVAVQLYPNPAFTIVTIACAEQIQQVEIYDILGNLVITSRQKQIAVNGLSAGCYFAKITGSNFIKYLKFIKE